jgi:1-aminocyclopropane-1-carboxylate deaminase
LIEHPLGGEVLVKRDDLSGYGRGGVKTRKIERLFGYMLTKGYNEFITVVANVTNLMHDMVPVLERYNFHWQVFIVDEPQLPTIARKGLFKDVAEKVHFVGPGKLSVASSMIWALFTSLNRKHHPFLVPPSLMHPAGAIGSASGFIEMVDQLEASGISLPSTVFITAASGTTLAGFLIAENILRHAGHLPIRVIGVQVYPGRVHLWILGLIRWTERFLGLRERVPADRIELISSNLYGGFGIYPAKVADLCRQIHVDYDLNIDPIFGGKTWLAMESYLAQRAVSDNRPILYWHCGYTPDWYRLDQLVNQADE